MNYPRLFRLKIFRRLSFSYLFLVFITVTGITVILYARFTAASTQENVRLAIGMLKQSSFSASVVCDQVRYVADQLLTTPEVISLLFAREIDHYRDYQASLKIQILQNAYPFIDSIGIYNGIINRYWNTRLISAQDEKDLLARVRGSGRIVFVDCFPRVLVDTGSDARRRTNVISFILYPNFRFPTESTTAIIINVSESHLSAILRGMSVDPEENLLVTNDAGRVIAAKKSSLFLQDQNGEEYFQRLARSAEDQGSLEAHVGAERSLVTFVTASAVSWRFISIRPFWTLMPQLDSLRRMTIIVAFLILSVGSIFSLFVARFVYAPINILFSSIFPVPAPNRQTVDEVTLLESALAQSKRLCLKYLLLGTTPEEPFMNTLLASYARELVSSSYRVCVLKIDGYDPYCKRHQHEERDSHKAALFDAVSDIFSGTLAVQVIVMEENEIVLLLGSNGGDDLPAVRAGLREVQRLMSEHFRISFSTGIGCVAMSPEGLSGSYHSAREAGNQRFFIGKGAIIASQEIEHYTATELYPQAIETKLLETFSIERQSENQRHLDEFRRCIERMPIDRAMGHSIALALAIEQRFSPLLTDSKGPVAPDLAPLETLDEIFTALRHYCLAISTAIRERGVRRGDELVCRVKRFLEEHYSEPALNLDMVANHVAHSPAYVGKLFKKATGYSFAGHLNALRMEKAKGLLESTDLPVGVIAERIGVSNATYLFTLFKKAFAQTPQHYREHHAAGTIRPPKTIPPE